MQKFLYKFLIVFSFNIVISSFSFAIDWKYIGYGLLNNNDIFYVFVNIQEKTDGKDNYLINEKHIFNKEQLNSNGDKYISVEIERDINCKNKTIQDKRADFIDIDGKLVNSYTKDNIKPVNINNKNSINFIVLNEFCK